MMLRRLKMAGGGVAPPSGDPHWSNVLALLHFDGSDGGTTFVDEKGTAWAAGGNAQIDTDWAAFGQSMRCDGNGDYIQAAAAWPEIGANEDFTLEFRIRLAAATGVQFIVGFGQLSGQAPGLLVIYNHSAGPGKLQVVFRGTQKHSSQSLVANTDYAVCIERKSGTGRIYIDGVVDSTHSGITTAINLATNGQFIGCKPSYGGNTWALNGWIDELRFTKGVARYGGAPYAVATAPFPAG